jgi:hypothetical protein
MDSARSIEQKRFRAEPAKASGGKPWRWTQTKDSHPNYGLKTPKTVSFLPLSPTSPKTLDLLRFYSRFAFLI